VNVTFHADFMKNLEGLDGSLKSRAWDFVTKITKDPEATGLDLKLPQGAADRRVRTARVDLNHRAVLFLVGEGERQQLVLAAIKPHDEAYAYASRLRMKVNASSGAVELRVLDPEPPAPAPVPAPAPQRSVPAPQRSAEPQQQCLPFTVAELTALGIDDAVASAAIGLTDEDDLLSLVLPLPRWQGSLLLDLASGRSLDDVRADYVITPVDPDHADTDEGIQEALERPTSRMEFAVTSTDAEVQRMLAGDFAEWRVFLHPTQRAVAYRPVWNGPYRLSGGAGTGKTVVALHRATYLASRTPSARVLLCTFNRALAAQLTADVQRLAGVGVAERIDVLGVDQLARQIVTQARGAAGTPIDDRTERSAWESAAVAAGLGGDPVLTPGFLRDEYRYIILAQGLADERAYLTAARRGRGTRLDRAQRRAVWKAGQEFLAVLRQNQQTTFVQLAAEAVEILSDGAEAGAVRRYDHVVVDEGQDLQPVHWRMLRALVAPGANDIFLCEDGHQRLYGQRVVLSRLGIETRGRSRRLTFNYRTTRQILGTALAVLQDVTVEDLEGESDPTTGYRSAMTGPPPATVGCANRAEETTTVVDRVREWLAAGPPPGAGTIGVLVRRKRDAGAVQQALTRAGIKARLVGAERATGNEPVHVVTMHSAKGSEYRYVVVLHADDQTIPDSYALSQVDPDERDDQLARERFLLYVACSRAREQLVITWSGQPSRFLAGLLAGTSS
jgi:superfamily I DNA/RNA helicase